MRLAALEGVDLRDTAGGRGLRRRLVLLRRLVKAKVIRKECKSRMECSSKRGIAIATVSEAAIPRLPVRPSALLTRL
jgi:hypothetical protein